MIPRVSRGNLLVVDDDESTCLALRATYSEIDFSVDFESDGERGVARAEQGHYHLLILGLAIKTMDGFAVLRRIRRNSSLPILVLSGREEKADRLTSLEFSRMADIFVPDQFVQLLSTG